MEIKVEKFSDISHILNENKTQNMEAKLLISRPISYEKSNKNKEILELLVPLSKEKGLHNIRHHTCYYNHVF